MKNETPTIKNDDSDYDFISNCPELPLSPVQIRRMIPKLYKRIAWCEIIITVLIIALAIITGLAISTAKAGSTGGKELLTPCIAGTVKETPGTAGGKRTLRPRRCPREGRTMTPPPRPVRTLKKLLTPSTGGSVEENLSESVKVKRCESVSGATTVRMKVTAYCPCKECCGKYADGITASGRKVTFNGGKFVAADTEVLPFGTMISIPDYANNQPVPVLDIGGAIKGNRIDVFYPTHKQALQWGVRNLDVVVSR
jgi:3D (Asp-Asp-Asp) domain-containing protein